MTKLRRPHWIALAVVAVAMAASPAAVLAAGEDSSEGAPASEGASPPASTGWVPQGSGSESSGDGTTSVRRGSSLGSGASPNQAPQSASQEPSYTSGASSSYESESPAPASEELASTPQTGSGVGVVKHPVVAATAAERVPVALGAATRVSAPEPSPVADTRTVTPALVEPAATTRDQVSSSGPNPLSSLALLALIVAGLILVCVVRLELRAGQATPRRSFLGLSRTGQRGRRPTPARRSG